MPPSHSGSIASASGSRGRRWITADADWALGAWSTNLTGSALPMTLTDLSATNQPQRFYRLEAVNP